MPWRQDITFMRKFKGKGNERRKSKESKESKESKDSERSIASAIEIDLHRIRFRQILTFIGDNATDQSTGIK